MRYITAQEARIIDKRAQEEFGIPGLILMENAGRMSAELAMKMLAMKKGKLVVCVCGRGNNGGDGFVASRYLFNKGISTHIFLIGNPRELKGDARVNYMILKNMGARIEILENKENFNLLRNKLEQAGLIIDAIFGTGLEGNLKEPYKSVIELINASGKPVLALDVPSGLDADEGKVLGACVKASRTITFALPKTGFTRNDGPVYTGKITVADISIPKTVLDEL